MDLFNRVLYEALWGPKVSQLGLAVRRGFNAEPPAIRKIWFGWLTVGSGSNTGL